MPSLHHHCRPLTAAAVAAAAAAVLALASGAAARVPAVAFVGGALPGRPPAAAAASPRLSSSAGDGQAPGDGAGGAASPMLDRFRADCPADPAAVRLFDPALPPADGDGEAGGGKDDAWVAVYRSSNNLPSVIMRDGLFQAMKIATTVDVTDATAAGGESGLEVAAPADAGAGAGSGVEAQAPVAVARLRPDGSGSHVLDCLRCSLKKEDTDVQCDGGSDHAEALGVCLDELLTHHLRTTPAEGQGSAAFDGSIRVRATLVSAPLLTDRGYAELDEFPLPADMCTHVSDLAGCLGRYADRVVGAGARNAGARDRALKILGLLGQRSGGDGTEGGVGGGGKKDDGGEEEDYDPWDNVQIPGQWK